MIKILKFILFALSFMLMQGCATHQNFVKKYNAWRGQNIAHLISQIGYPDSTFVLPNKNKVYVYEKSRIYSVPSPVFGYGYNGYFGGYGTFGYGSDIIQETCKLFIETNKKGIIVNWGSRGNSCVSN